MTLANANGATGIGTNTCANIDLRKNWSYNLREKLDLQMIKLTDHFKDIKSRINSF